MVPEIVELPLEELEQVSGGSIYTTVGGYSPPADGEGQLGSGGRR